MILQFCRCGGLFDAKGNPDGFLSHYPSLRNLRLDGILDGLTRKTSCTAQPCRTFLLWFYYGIQFSAAAPTGTRRENIALGVLGALLFSAAGGLVHFGLLQLGYIAWISALVGMAAGYFGYGLFSGRKNTVHGAILAVVFTMLMIVAAEYFGLAKEIFDAFKETYDIAFRDALASVPDFLTEAEIRTSVLKDLGIAFVFSILEAVFFIRDAVRKSRAAAAAETEAAAKNPAEF